MRLQCELLFCVLCTILQVNLEPLEPDGAEQEKQAAVERNPDVIADKIVEELGAEVRNYILTHKDENSNLDNGEIQEVDNSENFLRAKNSYKLSQNEENKGKEKKKEQKKFPFFWILLMLVPLIATLVIFIACFLYYKRAYNKAASEMRSKTIDSKVSSSLETHDRKSAGLQRPALDVEIPASDSAGFGTEVTRIKEGGIGSIMRDPDLDSAAREEAPKTYKMVYSGKGWKTVKEVRISLFI